MKAGVRKKTFNLDVGMIEAVRRLFDTETDTEAIQRALRKAIEDREVEEPSPPCSKKAASARCIGEVPSRGIKAWGSRGSSRIPRTSPPGGPDAEGSPSLPDTPAW